MNNWLPTFPLLNRTWSAQGPAPEDYKDWSVAELLAGRRFAQSEPIAAPEQPLSDGVGAGPATTASQPDWLAGAQWQAPPELPAWPKPPEQDPWSRYDGWSIPELLAGHRLAQPTDVSEAAQAQEARNVAAYRQSQSTRPIGGREEGPVTDRILDIANPIPQSPLDVGLLALGGPFKPLVKALVLGASGVLESSEAEAGRRWRSLGGSAARRAARLPMDDEARMARAKAMGFNMTELLGHGTAFDFRAFDPRKFGSTTGARTSRQGIWTEVNPTRHGVAADSAMRAAKEGTGLPRVMPLMYRAKNEKVIDFPDGAKREVIEAMIKQAWADGHDAVRFLRYRSPNGIVGDAVLVRYPSQLRHPSAVFDPLKKQSRDLFSSVDTAPPDDGDATARRARLA
jgi:hypothetical protein